MIRVDETEPEGYEWYREQIAGHHPSVVKGSFKQIGLLKKKNGPNVLKLVQEGLKGDMEVNFYKDLAAKEAHILKQFIPTFFGLKDIVFATGKFTFLELSDIAEEFDCPCQMDVKIGLKTFDHLAPAEKQESESKKYPPQLYLGFRLLGYRLNGRTADDDVKIITKDRVWGRSLCKTAIPHAFQEFLSNSNPMQTTHIIESFLSQLRRLLSWFDTQTSYNFFASSLLFVYEGNLTANDTSKATIKMIDFSHTYSNVGALDQNYIPGLVNLIRIFENILIEDSTDLEFPIE
uniref:Kinase n=1 Tax=Rhabditophanes sp. KR3021 TaxID=114890 RepID=A0AC35TKN1_9BILA